MKPILIIIFMRTVIIPASAAVNAQVKNQSSSKKTVSNLDQVLRFARKKFLNFPILYVIVV